MRPSAVDRFPTSLATVTRRDFLLAIGAAYASRFPSIAGAFVDWLTRWCLFDGRAPATAWQGA